MQKTVWLQISSGRGPTECSRVVCLVYGELEAAAEKIGLAVRLLEAVPDRYPKTLKSMLVAIDGPTAEALQHFVSQWIGTVQWIGSSPFRPHHRRRNWYVGIDCVAIPKEHFWSMDDIRIETMRSSGPGGQHVNTTDSAVRVTHIPTGLSAMAREERSQHLNRNLALARLSDLLERKVSMETRKAKKDQWNGHNRIERGNPVKIFKEDELRA